MPRGTNEGVLCVVHSGNSAGMSELHDIRYINLELDHDLSSLHVRQDVKHRRTGSVYYVRHVYE